MTREPRDRSERERIRTDHAATLFVVAGAGTGKTRALVDRVVALVAGGRDLRRVAAITFTEAAAAELRDRVRDALDAAAAGNDPSVAEPRRRERCRAALGVIDEATLTTLHGFAHRILTEHPLEAGLPPRFEVLDDLAARIELAERWRAFVDALFDDPTAEPALTVLLAMGITPSRLYDVARALHDDRDRLRATDSPRGPLPAVDAARLIAALDPLLAARARCRDPGDLLARHLDALVPYRQALGAAHDPIDLLDLLVGAPKLECRAGRAGNWEGAVAGVREVSVAAQRARDELVGELALGAFSALRSRIVEWIRRGTDDRRTRGRLEFHDLLVLTRDVLRGSASLRAAVGRRYDALLIDEFQDTDPLQIEIAVLAIAGDADVGDGGWSDITVEPGRLFIVGDPEQSIYRFRRADLAVYDRVATELAAVSVELSENFRSAPEVLDWVNTVFAGLLGEGLPSRQAVHRPLLAHRSSLGERATVGIFGCEAGDRIGSVREREAAEVAALLRTIVAEAWPIQDPATGKRRAARLADVALLLPTRTALPQIEAALESADVPMRIESQALVYATAEVRDLLAVLSAIDDPTDGIAVVAALRSPGFGCSDADLAEHRARGGSWDYRCGPADAAPEPGPVRPGLAAMRSLHDQRWWLDVGALVETVVRDRRLLELSLAHRRPRDHWRRIRYLCDQAHAYDDRGGGDLRGFVEWVQLQAEERARAIEVVVPEADDDAVRVLTVHGAKGLEFPIVVLAGLNAAPRHLRAPVLWGGAGPECAIGADFRTAGYEACRVEERDLDRAERLRVLYVATTRARDHLLVSVHRKTGDRDSLAARLVGCLRDDRVGTHVEPGVSTREPASAPRRTTDEPAAAAPVAERAAARDAWIESRAAMLEHAARPVTIAATTLARAATDGAAEDPALAKDGGGTGESPAWPRGRAGTAIGRAVHATLQSVDVASGGGVRLTARGQALAEGIAGRERDIVALVRSVLDAPVVREAVAGGRFWREVPVVAAVGEQTVEGFVDLLVHGTDGLLVVDYKTDTARTDLEIDAVMGRYEVQGAAYALALEHVLGIPVARCVFVFARARGEAVQREVADLPAAMDRVRTLPTAARSLTSARPTFTHRPPPTRSSDRR